MLEKKSDYIEFFTALNRDPVWVNQSFMTNPNDSGQIWEDFLAYILENGYQPGYLLDDVEEYNEEDKWPIFLQFAVTVEVANWEGWGDEFSGWQARPPRDTPHEIMSLLIRSGLVQPQDWNHWEFQPPESAGDWQTPHRDESRGMWYLYDPIAESYRFSESGYYWMSLDEADQIAKDSGEKQALRDTAEPHGKADDAVTRLFENHTLAEALEIIIRDASASQGGDGWDDRS